MLSKKLLLSAFCFSLAISGCDDADEPLAPSDGAVADTAVPRDTMVADSRLVDTAADAGDARSADVAGDVASDLRPADVAVDRRPVDVAVDVRPDAGVDVIPNLDVTADAVDAGTDTGLDVSLDI